MQGVRGWMGSVDVTETQHEAEHVRDPAGKAVPAAPVLSSSYLSFQGFSERGFLASILYKASVRSFLQQS